MIKRWPRSPASSLLTATVTAACWCSPKKSAHHLAGRALPRTAGRYLSRQGVVGRSFAAWFHFHNQAEGMLSRKGQSFHWARRWMTPVHAARATRLYGFCRCTLVVEARSAYSNDRTWCFWGDPSVAAPYPTRHHWQTLRVANAGNSVLLDCGSTPCQRAAAQDFYAAAQAWIDQQPNVT